MQTSFPRNYMAAIVNCAATKDVRYYLNGVLVESMSSETRLAATDGNIAGCFRHDIVNADRFEVIIPLSIIAIAIKLKLDMMLLECVDGRWSLSGVPFVPVDGKFPDYRRIIPTSVSSEAGFFNPELLFCFHKVGKALGRRDSPIIRQNGEHSALVHFYDFDNFVGVVMPLRAFTEKKPDKGMPTWGPARN